MNRLNLIRLLLVAAFLGAPATGAAQPAHDAIDRPLRRLQISVRFEDSSREQRVDQRVQVLEGGRAVIYTGQSRPLRQRQYVRTPGGVIPQQVIVVQDQTTGFEVVPRLAGGGRVILDFSGSTVGARLGQWIELQGVWLKVEELGN